MGSSPEERQGEKDMECGFCSSHAQDVEGWQDLRKAGKEIRCWI